MTTEHVLYGFAGSGSAAVEAALELAGLPYRIVGAATWEERSALAELRAVNPLQQIPTLVFPDGAVVSESAAVLIELGLRHPESPLLPQGAAQRAQALRGLVYIAANCYSAIGIVDYPERWLPQADAAALEALRAGTRGRLHVMWEHFADLFEPAPFLCGAEPGALDLLAAVVSRWSGARAHLRRQRRAWSQVLKRVDEHPRLAPVWARHWPNAG